MAVVAAMAACSEQDSVQMQPDENTSATTTASPSEMKTAGDVYPEFSKLMDKLYPSGYYVEDEVAINDNGTDYYTYKVALGEKGDMGDAGYFIKDDSESQVYYLAHDAVNKIIDQYNFDASGTLVHTIFDVKNNPDYQTYGFTATAKPGRRFFGRGDVHTGDCEHDAVGDTCSRRKYTTYYVLGVGVGTRDEKDLQTGGPLREPCSCLNVPK